MIIQEMIAAESSGVAFGMNPLNGNAEEKLINAVFGLGEGLVSGELNADNFILNNGKITAHPTEKAHKIILDSQIAGGTIKKAVEKKIQLLPSLQDKDIVEIGSILDKLLKEYGKPQDIEFALKDEKIFLLQSRHITAVPGSENQKEAMKIKMRTIQIKMETLKIKIRTILFGTTATLLNLTRV